MWCIAPTSFQDLESTNHYFWSSGFKKTLDMLRQSATIKWSAEYAWN